MNPYENRDRVTDLTRANRSNAKSRPAQHQIKHLRAGIDRIRRQYMSNYPTMRREAHQKRRSGRGGGQGRRRGTLMRRGRRIRRAWRRSERRLIGEFLGPLLGAVVRIGSGEGAAIYGGSGRSEVGKESRAVTAPSIRSRSPCSSPPRNFLDVSDAAGDSRGGFEKGGGSVCFVWAGLVAVRRLASASLTRMASKAYRACIFFIGCPRRDRACIFSSN
jgi:hypothetical protein